MSQKAETQKVSGTKRAAGIIGGVAFAIGFFLLLVLSLLAASCLPGISAPPYTEKSFTVGVGEKHTISAQVKEGQTIEGDFSVSGQQDYIDFYIKDPFGGLTYGVIRAEGSHRFTAEARESGTHTLYFDNSFSFGASRQVALRYRVR